MINHVTSFIAVKTRPQRQTWDSERDLSKPEGEHTGFIEG